MGAKSFKTLSSSRAHSFSRQLRGLHVPVFPISKAEWVTRLIHLLVFRLKIKDMGWDCDSKVVWYS